ncbi:thioredoxin fold domain-containing protein [Duganella sp. FT50W]|uniref:Thiol:disulfide interchange protein n=1 Tax=Duganella lactea TaxID=2692173 RepID=A0A6L8MRG3_9BURK|nr:DsbC family protein [Duganella lactea]MYM37026.1 thioredoxin fold domain-containing protein [Duganella lactea]MYM84641.1 thioredoxin fold domain-containing protein [Duganella lactea]
MRNTKIALLSLSVLMASCVEAQTPPSTDAIKKLIEPRLGANVKVDSVTATPYSGLYEVRIGSDILYTDKTATYLVNGHIFNLSTGADLTRERIEEINKIKFSDLPLDKAIKAVKGDGSRVIAVFEDPNCGYCKRLRQTTLKETDNVTIYTFMYNILSDDSFVKSKNVWCAADRQKAWDDWMLNGKAPATAAAGCESPNDEVLALGHKLGIQGTPAIFFADGSRIPGAIDAKALEDKFSKIKK